ncbi:DNA-processing protein DprA [Vulgatibacter incomptus]|uniref:Rossmann fold nucleotide-binding protein Smf n=1 Tax=Vulgatibacter incomptus TaxID=1391653 RepID=A0A0K1PCI3_9BACT|nr:DNA-processing protein DprA [Vulgatibacter incomptus]AKU91220.1 Rossmann fold nucleotide-binding protein Smf [Vulgatibacter incomptus]
MPTRTTGAQMDTNHDPAGVDAAVEKGLRAALWLVRGISGRAIAAAAASFGSLEAACAAPREALAAAMGLGPGGTKQLLAAPDDLLSWARSHVSQVAARGGRLLLRGDDSYPDLGTLADPPEAIWLRGAMALASDGCLDAVAIVGARRADLGAARLALGFGASVAAAGFAVVSGGALGVDAAAHQGALDAGGRTVAILGSGVLRPLPASNRRLFSRMLASGGGLVSELPPLEPARAEHFPRRNRLIAAVARAVVVVRAAAGSGSLYTARAMRALGRPVYVVPAPELGPASAGGEALLADGAIAVRTPAELVDALTGRQTEAERTLDPLEGRILAAMDPLPAGVAEVAGMLGMSASEVSRIVAGACARGLARPAGPGRFVAVRS